MRGEPLHVCVDDHPVIFHREPACPFCAVLRALAAAQRRIAALELALSSRKRQAETPAERQ